MSKMQKVQYAVFAAEQVIDIYEKKYPDDERPRKAIKAAKDYLKSPSKKTKAAADAAACVAADVAAADAAACAAADTAAYVADAAACVAAAYAAACAAADTAAYVADAAYAVAYAAACVAAAVCAAHDAVAGKELQIKIIEYGKNLIK